MVAGAPICPLKNLDEVISRFSEQERSRVIYFGAGQRVNLALRRQPKHGIVSLGAQPIWNPGQWSNRVLTRSSLRYQFRRARHKGVVIRDGGGNGEILGGLTIAAFGRTAGGFTAATFNTNGGGNSTVQYHSAALANALGSGTNVSGIREF